MSMVLLTLGQFVTMMLVAIFVQNIIFTRALGASRLVFLVRESSMDGVIFCSLLTMIQVISAPMAYFVNLIIGQPSVWFREYIRPLVLMGCAILAFAIVLLIVFLIRPAHTKEIVAALPMATFNSAVLGPMLLTATSSFSFVATMGFALGSGLGYGLAVLLLTEGQRKLNNRSVPVAFRGLPINLLYIGILALAIYGITGHRLAY